MSGCTVILFLEPIFKNANNYHFKPNTPCIVTITNVTVEIFLADGLAFIVALHLP